MPHKVDLKSKEKSTANNKSLPNVLFNVVTIKQTQIFLYLLCCSSSSGDGPLDTGRVMGYPDEKYFNVLILFNSSHMNSFALSHWCENVCVFVTSVRYGADDLKRMQHAVGKQRCIFLAAKIQTPNLARIPPLVEVGRGLIIF